MAILVAGLGLAWLFFWLTLIFLPQMILAVVGIVDQGAILWQLDTTPVEGLSLRLDSRVWDRGLAGDLVVVGQILPFLVVVAVVAGLTIRLCAAAAGTRGRALQQAVRTGAVGIDIVASHDVISSSMLQLGEPRRVRRIDQCASLLADHTTYFRHGCATLPILAAEIERAAGLKPASRGYTGAAVDYHRSGLLIQRRTRPWAIVAAALAGLTAAAALDLGSTGSILVLSFAVTFAWGATTVSCRLWLGVARRVARRPWYAAALEETRRKRRTLAWTLVLVAVADVLVGGGFVVVSGSASDPTGYRELSSWALIIGQALVACAWFSFFGLLWADWAAAICLAASAPLWLSRGTVYGTGVGVITLVLVGFAVARAARATTACRRSTRADLEARALPASK